MARVQAVRAGVLVVAIALLLAPSARADDAGITGIVRDSSGDVLPGVTVAAASAVLIEQQRMAITDSEGRYVITRLRPGTSY